MSMAGGSAYSPKRSSIWTIAAIGVVACVCADATHEILGHMLVAWVAHDRIVSLSTVAIQTVDKSRFVAAAGTAANLLVGTLALQALFRSRSVDIGWLYFLCMFSAFNLLNCGYLVASALFGNGDWALVTEGLQPEWLWRGGLAAIGATLYALSIRGLAGAMAPHVRRNMIAIAELRRVLFAGYVSGGTVLTAAALFNPIGARLIFLSGMAASFGLNWGLLLVPKYLLRQTGADQASPWEVLPVDRRWLVAAVLSCGLFIGIFGPGIRFAA